jgi:hypothetical protein
MFTLENSDSGDVVLKFTSDAFSLKFSPEDVHHLSDDDAYGSFNNDAGHFYGNGVCRFDWSPDDITFWVATHDKGNGGDLSVTVRMTPIILKSLRACLELWRTKLDRKFNSY